MQITNIWGVFTFIIVPMVLFPISLLIYNSYEKKRSKNIRRKKLGLK